MNVQEQLKGLRKVTWEAIDQDMELERDLRALAFFFWAVLMEGPNMEREITGCSFSQRGRNTLLVVKSMLGDIPQVAFCTAKFPMDCVRAFGRLWLDDSVKWHPDRYGRT